MMNKYLTINFYVCVLFTLGVTGVGYAQSFDMQALELKKRDRTIDKHYYLDSLLNFTAGENEITFSAHILKGEIYKSDQKHVDALNELKLVYGNENAINYPKLLGESYLSASEIYIETESYDLAEDFLVEAYKILDSPDDAEKKAVILIKSSLVAKKLNNYPASLKHLESAYQIYNDLGNHFVLNEIAKDIGVLTLDHGDFDKAKKYLGIALDGYGQNQDFQEQIRVYEVLARIHAFEKNTSLQIEMLENALVLSEEYAPVDYVKNKTRELVSLYSADERNREALQKQMDLLAVIGSEKSVEKHIAETELSELHRILGNSTDAILALHRANEIAIDLDSSQLILQSTNHISNFYKNKKDWRKAYEFKEIHDSLLALQVSGEVENSLPVDELNETQANADESFISEFMSLGLLWKVISLASIFLVFFSLFLLLRSSRKKRKIRQILEWKVYKRTKELHLLNSELNTYIYKSSHDLRNPLTSIKSLITLLQKESHNEISEKYLDLIHECTDQMDEILLNLSRAVDYKRVEVKVEQVRFNQVKSEIEEVFQKELGSLNLDWNIREKAPFFSDPSLIKVILKKTITNSLQYRIGSSNDYCKISIITDSSGAHVSVEDNGQGIAEKVKDKVFDMFEKGTHKSKGAGLGLYLVKIASEKIRAKITLESQENKGAKLVFKLPNLA